MVTFVKAEAPADQPTGPTAADIELDQLAAQAAELEGAAAPGAPAQPVIDTAAELREALGLLRAIGAPAFGDWPDYGVRVWSDAQIGAIAAHGATIMDRNGWTMGEMWATWGPYIGLIGAVAPPALATYAHVRQRKAQAEAEARARQARRPAAPDGLPEDAEGVRP